MKFLIGSFLFISAAHALDYDPQFHIKHRYNRHEEVVSKFEAVPPAQKMEASETSKEPLKTTPDNRKIFKPEQKE
jgi:hypothetical protein